MFKKFRRRKSLWKKLSNSKKIPIRLWRSDKTNRDYPVPKIKRKRDISSKVNQFYCQLFILVYAVTVARLNAYIFQLDGLLYTIITAGFAFIIFIINNEIITDFFETIREE